MSDTHSHLPPLDVATISDPETRRALRALHQQFGAALDRQQMEINALLEVLLHKGTTSLGEFKRHLAKLQGGDARGGRIQEAMGHGAHAAPAPVKPVMR